MTFERYVVDRWHPLVRTATAITGDAHLGEELVQEVLIKLRDHWGRVGNRDTTDAYVRRMLVNEYTS